MGNQTNERSENIIDGALETLKLPSYNTDNLRDENAIFFI
jgi:hypothetical protein